MKTFSPDTVVVTNKSPELSDVYMINNLEKYTSE